MTKTDKIKNILSFLCIIFGESEFMQEIMEKHPDYLIEKFERYVLSSRDESSWGMHPSIRRCAFNTYCKKYELPIDEEII